MHIDTIIRDTPARIARLTASPSAAFAPADPNSAVSAHRDALRYVIFASYGNDSIAMIQWAQEQELEGVAVVFTDTGWAGAGWMERVDRCEDWVRSLGFAPHRTTSIGFVELARRKKSFPKQQFQWCSGILKIEPGQKWLDEHDPERKAVCLVGVRREESRKRAAFPAYLLNSASHGGRVMVAPLVEYTDAQRDVLIRRAGFEVLPHRSRECRCINANRDDMRRFTDGDWQAIREAETEIGQYMYRPSKHMQAAGADEVRRWANSERGAYRPLSPSAVAQTSDELPEEDLSGCTPGWCES